MLLMKGPIMRGDRMEINIASYRWQPTSNYSYQLVRTGIVYEVLGNIENKLS
jgi:hypothetical protein